MYTYLKSVPVPKSYFIPKMFNFNKLQGTGYDASYYDSRMSIEPQIEVILKAQKILLTTHRNSDGDGIGSLAALYGALKNLNKQVWFAPVDEVPKRYSYMLENVDICSNTDESGADLLIILDTNHGDLCNPLYQNCINKNCKVLFIDHHIDNAKPHPLIFRIMNLEAASTGEIVFDLIKTMNVPINDFIAGALYSSLTFDTQAFKLVRNSSRSHFIAGELAGYKINTEEIQRALFAHWTPDKMLFLSELIHSAKYSGNQKVVGLSVTRKQLEKYKLHGDDVNDLVDMFTLIPTVKFAYFIRQSEGDEYKVSFRSALNDYAYTVATRLGGGGHKSSAGTWLKSETVQSIEDKINNELRLLKLFD
jgi:phosphoesterase RecJ-like protein